MPRTTRARAPRRSTAPSRAAGKTKTAAIEIPVTPTRPSAEPNGTSDAIVKPSPITLPIAHEQIAAEAYALWRLRGGSPEQNWLEAEARLRQQAELRV